MAWDLFTNDRLSEAFLIFSNLNGAYLRDADLSRADLRDADLSGTILDDVNLTEATFNNATIFPDGFDPTHHNMKNIDEPTEEVKQAEKSLENAE